MLFPFHQRIKVLSFLMQDSHMTKKLSSIQERTTRNQETWFTLSSFELIKFIDLSMKFRIRICGVYSEIWRDRNETKIIYI